MLFLSVGTAGDQGLPHICTSCHWIAPGLLYHVHPPRGPGEFHHAPPQEVSQAVFEM
jgi:hypothetical protein